MPRAVVPFFPSLLTAGLYVLAFPNCNMAGFAWVALIPLIWQVCELEHTAKEAFLRGWLSGSLAYAGILYWLIPTFRAADQGLLLALPSLFALSAYLGLFWGAWAYILHKHQASAFFPLLGAAAWVALEYLRTYLFSGFPWTLLADSQYRFPGLIQIAAYTGVYGVSFLIVLVNLTLADLPLKAGDPRWKRFAITLGGIGLLLGYSFFLFRAPLPSSLPPMQVSLLQGNIDQYKKWNDIYVSEVKATYETLALRAAAAGAKLIIWPETSVPGYLTQEPALRLWLTRLIWKTKTHHIVGSPVLDNGKALNTAFSLSPTGWKNGEYSKQHLVPFGEKIPLQWLLGRWIPVLNALGGFIAGERSPVLEAAGVPVGMNICYEAIFPNLVRRSVQEGAQLIVNITNDGWYMKTAAPYQHLAPNVFRAVENHRWVLRANNTGVSAFIDPQGRLIAETPIYQARVLTQSVTPRTEKTFYTRVGDLFAWLCLIVSGIFLYRARIRA